MASVELDAVYEITNPSGMTAVFNDPANPNYVGVVTELTGFDSPDIRESADDLVQEDGGVHGDFFDGRRPVTISGLLLNPASVLDRNTRMDRLTSAVTALRQDTFIIWTPTGGEQRFMAVRLQNGPRFTGAWQKEFLVGLVAEDPRIYSTQIYQQTVAANTTGSLGGRTFDRTYDVSYGGGAPAGGMTVSNLGTTITYPTLIVYGPGNNPTITNATTGQSISLTYSLSSTEFLQIETNPIQRSILLNNQASRYQALDFATSSWWGLVPGDNDIRVSFSAVSAGASLGVTWRNAWR